MAQVNKRGLLETKASALAKNVCLFISDFEILFFRRIGSVNIPDKFSK